MTALHLKKITLLFILISSSSLAAMSDHFVTTWDTKKIGITNNTSINVPIYGTDAAYNVDWNNDGIFDEFNITGPVTHDFGSPGIKTIRISGNVPYIRFDKFNDRRKILSIDQWGTNPWSSMYRAFYSTNNLVNKASDTPNLSECDSLARMFWKAESIGGEQDTGNWNWNTSNITEMSYMFADAKSFNKDIGNWNTSNVSDFSSIFSGSQMFNQDIGYWDISNAINMNFLFYGARSFNQDLSQWDFRLILSQSSSSFSNFIDNTEMSGVNYDLLLVRLHEQQDSNIKGVLAARDAIYCSVESINARNALINDYGWSFYDKGLCQPELTIISPNFAFVDENKSYVIKVNALDQDLDTMSFSISGGVDKRLFSIDNSNGDINFINSPDFENPLDHDSNNIYDIEITVVDDEIPQETAIQLFEINVNNVDESLPSEHFVTTWNTNLADDQTQNSVTIHAKSYYFNSFHVDWNNDGVFDDYNVIEDITHGYATPGLKTIRISGEFPRIKFRNPDLVSVDQWGSIPFDSLSGAFSITPNVVINALDIPNLSICKSLSYMFMGATSVGKDISLGNWNWSTGNIISMDSMFANAESLEQDISQWNISNLSSSVDMFDNISLSIENYDKLLTSWNSQSHLKDVKFDAGNSIYCSQDSHDARENLIDNGEGWLINDKGRCDSDLSLITEELIFAEENQTHVVDILITNPSNTTVFFSLTGGEDKSLFSINEMSGQLFFINPPDFENPSDSNGDNYYHLEISAINDAIPSEIDSKVFEVYVNNITEGTPSDDFVTTWKTDIEGTKEPNQIIIPIDSYDDKTFNVDWDNDGVYDEFGLRTGAHIHNYKTPGIKTIRISPGFDRINFVSDFLPQTTLNINHNKLMSIDQWGSNKWQSMYFSFFRASNLVNNATDIPNISEATNLSYAFSHASLIGSEPEIGNWNWDTSNITKMAATFYRASYFNKDISSWKTAKVNDMSGLFGFAISFNKDISLWDTGNVSNMDRLFIGAEIFNQSIGGWNTKEVTSMKSMFNNAVSFNQDTSKWSTNEVRYMESMFDNAISFDQDISSWKVNNVINYNDFLNNVKLSDENYEALLIGWNTQDLEEGVIFNGGLSIYCSQDAIDAHDNLTTYHRWSISDGGICHLPPEFTSPSSVNVNENELYVSTITAVDPNMDQLSFEITGGEDQDKFSINVITGEVYFNQSPDFENPHSQSNSNTYQIEVTVTDDSIYNDSSSGMLIININNVEETDPVDLDLQISSNHDFILSGDLIDITIEIANISNNDVVDAKFIDVLPNEFRAISWVCQSTGGASCSDSGTGEINDTINIPTGNNSVTYTVSATIADNYFDQIKYQAFITTLAPQYDQNMDNNYGALTLFNRDFVFMNGFEEPELIYLTAEKQILLDFSKTPNSIVNTPTITAKGLGENGEVDSLVHIRSDNGSLQYRFSEKSDGLWQVGEWQLTSKNLTLIKW